MAIGLRYFPILCILITGFASCRSKCACTPAPGMNLSLVFFAPAEIDTIVVKKFVKASGFTAFLDSVVLDSSNALYQVQGDSTEVIAGLAGAALTSGYDYEILFPAAGLNIRITAIDESHAEGNCAGKTQCTDPINSYRINDSLVTKPDPFDNSIAVRKP